MAMAHKLQCLQAVLFSVIGLSCASYESCEIPREATDIDWLRMNRVWYDAVDIPKPTTLFDCHNWVNVTKTDSGLKAVMEELTAGKQPTHFTQEFFRVRPGIYVENEGNEFEEPLYFITDYDNYFAPVFCSEEGWEVYVKCSRPEITGEDILKIRDLLVKNGIFAEMHVKDVCSKLNNSK